MEHAHVHIVRNFGRESLVSCSYFLAIIELAQQVAPLEPFEGPPHNVVFASNIWQTAIQQNFVERMLVKC